VVLSVKNNQTSEKRKQTGVGKKEIVADKNSKGLHPKPG